MDIALTILAGILLLIGLGGAVLPILPGPPLSYIGILLLQLTHKVNFSLTFMLGWLVAVIAVTLLDNLIPIWTTKKFGGSKACTWGSAIGMVIGMFFTPIGIILGTLLGAIVGEFLTNKRASDSLRAGWGALVGFLCGIIAKVMVCGLLLYYYIIEVVKIIS